jgi:hypothetical protein
MSVAVDVENHVQHY